MGGRVVPEFSDTNIRELLIRDYRLIYKIEETCIIIIALIHGKRDLNRLWEIERRGA